MIHDPSARILAASRTIRSLLVPPSRTKPASIPFGRSVVSCITGTGPFLHPFGSAAVWPMIKRLALNILSQIASQTVPGQIKSCACSIAKFVSSAGSRHDLDQHRRRLDQIVDPYGSALLFPVVSH